MVTLSLRYSAKIAEKGMLAIQIQFLDRSNKMKIIEWW